MIPRITIAVVSYGRNDGLLKRCLASIQLNTPPTCDLIVCLNETDTKSLLIANSYLTREGTIIYSKENIGIEGAIHLALQACRTDIMIRLDDDSHILHESWLSCLLEEIEQLPSTWGALGRLHQFGAIFNMPPGQGWVSKPWVKNQPWYKPEFSHLLEEPPVGVSGGFCVLNVNAAKAVGYPSDEYPHYEEDVIMALQLKMNGYTLHNSTLISELSLHSNKLQGRTPIVAVGDAPSRTNRGAPRKKWKGEFK